MTGYLRIIFQPYEYPSPRYDYTVAIQIGSEQISEVMQVVDIPSNAPAVLFCTPPKIRDQIYRNRLQLADELSKVLSRELLKLFGKKDTIDGYPKD